MDAIAESEALRAHAAFRFVAERGRELHVRAQQVRRQTSAGDRLRVRLRFSIGGRVPKAQFMQSVLGDLHGLRARR